MQKTEYENEQKCCGIGSDNRFEEKTTLVPNEFIDTVINN